MIRVANFSRVLSTHLFGGTRLPPCIPRCRRYMGSNLEPLSDEEKRQLEISIKEVCRRRVVNLS
jgi:hypothetical protein